MDWNELGCGNVRDGVSSCAQGDPRWALDPAEYAHAPTIFNHQKDIDG